MVRIDRRFIGDTLSINRHLYSMSKKLVTITKEIFQDEISITNLDMPIIPSLQAHVHLVIANSKACLKQNDMFQRCIEVLSSQSNDGSRKDGTQFPLVVALRESFSCKEILSQLILKLYEVHLIRSQLEEEMRTSKRKNHLRDKILTWSSLKVRNWFNNMMHQNKYWLKIQIN
jgi:hypothetical protein